MANRVIWHGPKATRVVYTAADKKMAKLTEKTKNNIKAFAPVKTGALKESITTSKDSQMKYKVSSSKDYAKYVEFGTSSMPPRPFFRLGISTTRI